MEGEAYLRDGKVHRDSERQIRILAHYLDGKAYDFYMQKVAKDNPSNWSLHKFFTELFNFCFPVDYRQRMRIKLENHYQKSNQSVSEYVNELEEMLSMVGTMPDDMKTVKLWYGLKTRTQKALWRDGFHPDISTWDEIIAKAEMIEIADNVLDRRDGDRSTARKSWVPNTAENSSTASRSVTYARRDQSKGRFNHGDRNVTRPSDQARQSSAAHNKQKYQGGNPTARTNSASNAPKKSVKFADLSEKEMAQLRAEGKCFLCKEPGHMSRNCPKRKLVTGSGSNKPPGVPSYSMEMSLIEDDDNSTEVLESVPFGSISMETTDPLDTEPEERWREWYPTWQCPLALVEERIGNCYALTAEYLLTVCQLYPGDKLNEHFSQFCSPHDRFQVKEYPDEPGSFEIIDQKFSFKTTVPKSRLVNPKFNIGHWYAKERARAVGLIKPTKEYPARLENPVVLVVTSMLRGGIHTHYPNVKPETWADDRFFVYLKDYGSSTYVIVDDDLDLNLKIDLSILENPEFNLISWYLGHAKAEGRFYEKYLALQRNSYLAVPVVNCVPYFEMPNYWDGQTQYQEELIVFRRVLEVMERCSPFPGDESILHPLDNSYPWCGPRFELDTVDTLDQKYLIIYDRVQATENFLAWHLAKWEQFSLGKWYMECCVTS